eukprot:4622313-Pleurochrysis_carterae.AAC.1
MRVRAASARVRAASTRLRAFAHLRSDISTFEIHRCVTLRVSLYCLRYVSICRRCLVDRQRPPNRGGASF